MLHLHSITSFHFRFLPLVVVLDSQGVTCTFSKLESLHPEVEVTGLHRYTYPPLQMFLTIVTFLHLRYLHIISTATSVPICRNNLSAAS